MRTYVELIDSFTGQIVSRHNTLTKALENNTRIKKRIDRNWGNGSFSDLMVRLKTGETISLKWRKV